MTLPPAAGWYPDPAGGGGQRWWNGQSWSESVAPAPLPPGAPLYPPTYQQPQRSGFLGQSGNRNALITFAIVAVYIVIAVETRIVFFGILPLAYAARSRRMKEPLWPLALGAAIVAVIIAIALVFGH